MKIEARSAVAILSRPMLCPDCGRQVAVLDLPDHQKAEHGFVPRRAALATGVEPVRWTSEARAPAGAAPAPSLGWGG